MTYEQRRRFDMLIRVRNFGAAHAQLFADSSPAHAAFEVVATEVERLEALDVAERLASHAGRAARKVTARETLFATLVRARNTARVLARTNPELAMHIALRAVVNDRLLLTMARQFASDMESHREQFAAHDIPLQDVVQQIDAFDAALNERGARREEQVQARAGIALALGRALEAVATLDVVVANRLVSDAATLAVWDRCRRLGRPKRRGAADFVPTSSVSQAA